MGVQAEAKQLLQRIYLQSAHLLAQMLKLPSAALSVKWANRWTDGRSQRVRAVTMQDGGSFHLLCDCLQSEGWLRRRALPLSESHPAPDAGKCSFGNLERTDASQAVSTHRASLTTPGRVFEVLLSAFYIILIVFPTIF